MSLKYLFSGVVLMTVSLTSTSQVMKVNRKGVTPVDVTKQTPASSYSIDQFAGKWQEVSRQNSSGRDVSFKDTLFYNFSGDNVSSRDEVNMNMKGEAAIEPGNVLVAAADIFTIRSLKNNTAVLDDGQYIHTLVRKKEFWYETLPTNEVVPEKFTVPVSVNPSSLVGKWKVYRREAEPGDKNGKVLISILNITTTTGNNDAKGEVTLYRDERLVTVPCNISLNGGRMHITTEKHSWDVNVYKADGNNLVFGDPSLMYYCKQL